MFGKLHIIVPHWLKAIKKNSQPYNNKITLLQNTWNVVEAADKKNMWCWKIRNQEKIKNEWSRHLKPEVWKKKARLNK